jgi:hypothetical protein
VVTTLLVSVHLYVYHEVSIISASNFLFVRFALMMSTCLLPYIGFGHFIVFPWKFDKTKRGAKNSFQRQMDVLKTLPTSNSSKAFSLKKIIQASSLFQVLHRAFLVVFHVYRSNTVLDRNWSDILCEI